jgi:hypothetical protein
METQEDIVAMPMLYDGVGYWLCGGQVGAAAVCCAGMGVMLRLGYASTNKSARITGFVISMAM